MLFVAVFLLLLAANTSAQQGLFDPYTFTEASCSGTYQWTTWFDTNDPNLTLGEFEVTSHIEKLFPGFMCANPTAIESQTSIDTNPTTTHDVFRINVKEGFFCLNQQVIGYKTKLCADYKVRYCCPVIAI